MKFIINEKKKEIVDAVRQYDTIIIKAETGTGKTSQVPQFLYNAGMRVVVVEPRMIEAMQAYNFVVKQRGLSDEDNTIVGCRTKQLYKNVKDFGILYCVGGYSVINRLKSGELSDIVLIVDEAHEWKLPQEVLMGWVNAFREKGNKLKVVFMSASINPSEIEEYYKDHSTVKTVEVKGNQFPVTQYTLNDYSEALMYAINNAALGRSSMFFRSGKNEIDKAIQDLKDQLSVYNEWESNTGEPLKVDFIPLHGNLSYEEQEKAFVVTENPRIIVCTNIAQSGVNPHVQCIFDNGHEKQMININGVDTLKEVLISKEDCRQRLGRAGRFEEGIYYLIEDWHDEKIRPEYPTPEIQRLTLEKTFMKLIEMGINPDELQFFHKPDENLKRAAFKLLRDVGALKNKKLTDIGRKMLDIPTSVQHARMIIEGEKLKCLSDVIKAVSILEIGSLLNVKHIRDNMKDYSDYTEKHNRSDLIAEIDIYDKIRRNAYGKDIKAAGIDARKYGMVRRRIQNLRTVLKNRGYDIDSKASNEFSLVQCFFSGLWMNIMIQDGYEIHDLQNRDIEWKGSYASTLYASNRFCFGIKQVIAQKHEFQEPTRLVLFRTIVPIEELRVLADTYAPGRFRFSNRFGFYESSSHYLSYTIDVKFDNYSDSIHRGINIQEDPEGKQMREVFKDEIKRSIEQDKVIFEKTNRLRESVKSVTGTGYNTMADALKNIQLN